MKIFFTLATLGTGTMLKISLSKKQSECQPRGTKYSGCLQCHWVV